MSSQVIDILIFIAICIAIALVSSGLIWCIVKIVKHFIKATEPPLTFDYELKQNMLPTGLYMICGRQRAGKGSLGCAIMDIDATYHMVERKERAQEVVDWLNNLDQSDPYELELPETIYYSKNDMYLTPSWINTNHVDIAQVALPETEEDAHFPPYSMIHLEEMDAFLNARTWKDGAQQKANIIDGYKWLGHDNLTVIGDAQVFGRLDAAVRALTTDIFYVIRRKDYYQDDEPRRWWQFSRRHDNDVVRTVWEFIWIKNQLHQQADALSKFGDFIKKDEYIHKCKFVYKGNIYERYNPRSGQAYWFKNLRKFHSAPHPSTSMTRDAVNDYCKRNARRAENATSETENNQ